VGGSCGAVTEAVRRLGCHSCCFEASTDLSFSDSCFEKLFSFRLSVESKQAFWLSLLVNLFFFCFCLATFFFFSYSLDILTSKQLSLSFDRWSVYVCVLAAFSVLPDFLMEKKSILPPYS